MQPNAAVSSFAIYCDPTPTPNHVVPRPFYLSPDRKICIVATYAPFPLSSLSSTLITIYSEFTYRHGGVDLHESINFIFFTSTLLADYPPYEHSGEVTPGSIQSDDSTPMFDESMTPPSGATPPSPIRIPWSRWGERTRLTLWRMPTSCFTICVSGTRVVRRTAAPVPRRYKIQVCDFNPFAAVDEVQVTTPATPPASMQRYVHARQDNVFKNTLLFEEPLYGFLPYLEVTTRNSFEMEDIMIDADNIYLVHVSRACLGLLDAYT